MPYLDLQLPVRARKLLADVTLQVGIRPRYEVAHVTADQHFHVAFTVTRGVQAASLHRNVDTIKIPFFWNDFYKTKQICMIIVIL